MFMYKKARGRFPVIAILYLIVIMLIVPLYGDDKSLINHRVIDLSSFDVGDNKTASLGGNYSFYWKKLYGYKDFQTDPLIQPDLLAPVPGVWNDLSLNGLKLPAEGYATYRMTIILPSMDTVGLKILTMSTAHELFVNERLVAKKRSGRHV